MVAAGVNGVVDVGDFGSISFDDLIGDCGVTTLAAFSKSELSTCCLFFSRSCSVFCPGSVGSGAGGATLTESTSIKGVTSRMRYIFSIFWTGGDVGITSFVTCSLEFTLR